MSVAKKLYELQEIDQEIESHEQTLAQLNGQMGDDREVAEVRTRLEQEQGKLEELNGQQHSLEWELDDIQSKITKAEEELYSGKIKNPKELTSLQHEVEILKEKRGQLEDKDLEIMEQIESLTDTAKVVSSELAAVASDWKKRQQEMAAEIQQLEVKLKGLNAQREAALSKIESEAAELYAGLKERRGKAVAKIDQGLCRGCRIQLPVADLQKARSGDLVQCSSCSRILFLA
jgi:predicted  nucleic acid-binding Zn-ribbon protein